MLVVLYCLSAFTFDRTKFAINIEVYPSGWFEQSASVNADPVQIAVIYKSLKSLRIITAFELLARVGVNVMFSLRLRYVVGLSRCPSDYAVVCTRSATALEPLDLCCMP